MMKKSIFKEDNYFEMNYQESKLTFGCTASKLTFGSRQFSRTPN